jgi:signal peptidase II
VKLPNPLPKSIRFLDKKTKPREIGLFFVDRQVKSVPVSEMTSLQSMLKTPTCRIVVVALVVIALDQLTKHIVLRLISDSPTDTKIVIDGFFRFVRWGNTGAAWSLFRGNNSLLAGVALIALVVLYFSRHHFNAHTLLGQTALGFICGGIVGNLIDRIRVGYVIDFLYFYLQQRGGGELGFPAFNVADSAICTGVGLIFLITWRLEHAAATADVAPGAGRKPLEETK